MSLFRKKEEQIAPQTQTKVPTLKKRLKRTMVRIRNWTSIIAVIAVGLMVWKEFRKDKISKDIISVQEKIAVLEALKLPFVDVMEYTKYREIKIPTKTEPIKIPIVSLYLKYTGDCTLATDARKATFSSIDPQKKTAVMELAAPFSNRPRVIHDKNATKIIISSTTPYGVFLATKKEKNEAMDEALELAQKKVEEVCNNEANISKAKENAEQVFDSQFGALGWHMTVNWK